MPEGGRFLLLERQIKMDRRVNKFNTRSYKL